MAIQHWFDDIHGNGAFDRLRSMLDDPRLAYEHIGRKFGLTRQRIAQIAKELGINARKRQRERTLRREPCIIKQEYPPDIRAVIDKIRRFGIQVSPYNSLQPSRPNCARRSQKMVLVNGLLCAIQIRKGYQKRPNRHEYARFDVTDSIKGAKIALWAIKRGRTIKLYIIPRTHLRHVSYAYIPSEGKYAGGSGKKPRKDWTQFEGAWHLLG